MDEYESQIVSNDREESRHASRDFRGGYRRISGIMVNEDDIPSADEIGKLA